MTLGESWSLLDKSGKDRGWRPGGYNPLAVNRANKRLYVGMHPNGAEGTHKTPAAEIWVYDLTTRSAWRASRQGALSMSVSQDDKPRLFTIDGGNVNVYDAAPVAPVLKGAIKGAGETALQVEPQILGGSREMTDPVFYSASAALACVLLLGALDKFRDLPGFAAAVSAYEILPAGISTPFALLRPGGSRGGRAAADARVAAGGRGPGAAGAGHGHGRAGVQSGAWPPRHGLRLLRSDRAGPARAAQDCPGGWWRATRRWRPGPRRCWRPAPPACRAACCGRTPRRCSLAASAVALYFTANHLLASHLKLQAI